MLEWIKSWFKKPEKPEYMFVWGVLHGPYYDEQEDCTALQLRVSVGGKIQDVVFWYHDEADALVVVDHFKTEFGPYVIDLGEYELVK